MQQWFLTKSHLEIELEKPKRVGAGDAGQTSISAASLRQTKPGTADETDRGLHRNTKINKKTVRSAPQGICHIRNPRLAESERGYLFPESHQL